jgi:competence protein ComGC
MNNKYTDSRSGRAGFTLLELLTVMLIMFMLMGMATVAMKGLIQGSGMSGAIRNVKSVLTQARQYAITKEQRVYVIFEKEGEKNSMTVCARYGVCDGAGFKDGNTGYYCVLLEDPLPWGTNTLGGATVYNLTRGKSDRVIDNPGIDKVCSSGKAGWHDRDELGFEVTERRFLPSGIEFKGSASSLPTIIFNPSGSADANYKIEVQEMYVKSPAKGQVEVEKLTGWVK